jgi:hypothetical protein
VFFDKTWTFRDAGKGKTEVLPADNYEFPFDVILDGSLLESVEGLKDTWVTYRFKAEIGRKYAKDIVVRKPLRIIRTLDASALELVHAMVSPRRPPSIAWPLPPSSFSPARVEHRFTMYLVRGKYLGQQNRLLDQHSEQGYHIRHLYTG